MTKYALLIPLLMISTIGIYGCGGGSAEEQKIKDNIEVFLFGRAETELRKTLNDAFERDNVFNPIFSVEIQKQNFSWQEARGLAFPDANIETTPMHNFRIASVSKTFTAVRVLQLVEEGKLNLDDRLTDVLLNYDMPAGFSVDDICRHAMVSCSGEITVRHLLNHTSGLKDYQFDFADNNPSHVPLTIMSAYDVVGLGFEGFSSIQWDANSILQFYLESGLNLEPMHTPGSKYHYADTNYLLLGLIIETATGLSLAENYLHYIFQPIGIEGAYLEWYEEARSGPTIHQYQDGRAQGSIIVDVVAAQVNTSADWAGGGIVANVGQVSRFLQALFAGELFENVDTLDEMLRVTAVNNYDSDNTNYRAAYSLGIDKRTYKLLNGKEVTLYGHTGFYGTLAYFHPETETSIVLALNQGTLHQDWLYPVLEDLNQAKLFGL